MATLDRYAMSCEYKHLVNVNVILPVKKVTQALCGRPAHTPGLLPRVANAWTSFHRLEPTDTDILSSSHCHFKCHKSTLHE